MKCFLFALILSAALANAQSLNLSVSPASVKAGGSSTLTITWQDAATSTNTAAFQWTAGGATIGAGSAGTALTSAGKSLACNGATCIGVSESTPLNNNPIASGVLATVPLSVPTGTAPGPLTISLSGVVAVNTTGSQVTVTSAPVTLTVLSNYDLNGDGVVNLTDVLSAVAQAVGSQSCSTADVNGDGKCNVIDVELVIEAALGLIH